MRYRETEEMKDAIRALADHWRQSAEEHRDAVGELILMTAEDEKDFRGMLERSEGILQCARELTDVILKEKLNEGESQEEEGVPTKAVIMLGEIPYDKTLEPGTPLRDASGAEIGEVVKSWKDANGFLQASVHLHSLVADGLFQAQMGIIHNLDDD